MNKLNAIAPALVAMLSILLLLDLSVSGMLNWQCLMPGENCELQPSVALAILLVPLAVACTLTNRLKRKELDTAHKQVELLVAKNQELEDAISAGVKFTQQVAKEGEITQQTLKEAKSAVHSRKYLLESMLPAEVLDKFTDTLPGEHGATSLSERKEGVFVLFADIVGFTKYCENHESEIVVALLDKAIRLMDHAARSCHVTKIKTIGDCYMAAYGLFGEKRSADPIISFADQILTHIHKVSPGWDLRIGIACGPVTAGIVGSERIMFDIWGATVNRASRIESSSRKGNILVDERTRRFASDSITFSDPAEYELRGVQGRHPLFFVKDVPVSFPLSATGRS